MPKTPTLIPRVQDRQVELAFKQLYAQLDLLRSGPASGADAQQLSNIRLQLSSLQTQINNIKQQLESETADVSHPIGRTMMLMGG